MIIAFEAAKGCQFANLNTSPCFLIKGSKHKLSIIQMIYMKIILDTLYFYFTKQSQAHNSNYY